MGMRYLAGELHASSFRSSRISKPEEKNKYRDNHVGIRNELGDVSTSRRCCCKAPGELKPGEIHRNKTHNELTGDQNLIKNNIKTTISDNILNVGLFLFDVYNSCSLSC